jgi:protein MAK16
MQQDEIIWQVIGDKFCSYRVVTADKHGKFCRNEYNLTGICEQKSCPLANSQYATVRDIDGKCTLMVKTIERAHMPSKLWESIPLSSHSEAKALEKIDRELEYWPSFIVDFCKKRYERIQQVYKKQRRLVLTSSNQTELSVYNKKEARREKTRERKAEYRAQVDTSVEKELLERLKTGVYGDIYNFPKKEFDEAMDQLDDQSELEYSETDEMFVEGEEEEEFDLDPKRQRHSHLEIEYEEEPTGERLAIPNHQKTTSRKQHN